MVEIIEREDPVLRKVALEVPVDEIKSVKIKKVIEDMKKALLSQDDGVGICAPQIGVSLRMFIVSGRTLADIADEEKSLPDMIFINPKIVKLSRKTEWLEEGCLSLRYLYGKVKRSEKATVKALDENGKKIEVGASGLLAQIFQHEIDHLDGILFIDKAKEVVDLPPEKSQEKNNEK